MPILVRLTSVLGIMGVAYATLGVPVYVHSGDLLSGVSQQVSPDAFWEGVERQRATDGFAPVIAKDQHWWTSQVAGTILQAPNWVSFDLPMVVVDALQHNPHIQAVTHRSAAAYEQIVTEEAVFDPSLAFSSKLGSTSDPVGNVLTTGGPRRLEENSWANRAAVTKLSRRGTQFEVSQQLGLLDSNSLYFQPKDQGNARLSLGLTKPLLRGAGKLYNERLIVHARLSSSVTEQQMREEIQDRIAQTQIVYWSLYQARCHLLQLQASIERGEQIRSVLQTRQDWDAGALELSKVTARMARREAARIRKELELKNLQTQLIALIASESLPEQSGDLEMIPLTVPEIVDIQLSYPDLLAEALNHRTDVHLAILNLEDVSLRLAISRNELLPVLNAIAGMYVSGLRGNSDVAEAFSDQFTLGRPGAHVGVEYAMPYGRRSANARNRAAQHQFREMSERYRDVILTVRSEVEIAARSLETAVRSVDIKREVRREAEYQEMLVRQRWELFGTGDQGVTILEDLLEQQDNLAIAEQELATSETDYMIALIELQNAMGTLLTSSSLPEHGDAVDCTQGLIELSSELDPS